MGPIVSQLPRKTGVERSNRPKAKILQRNSLVVKMVGLQAASGAVWGRYKNSSGGRNRENRPNIVRQLQDLLSDPESVVNLKVELAITIDVGEYFVKATYFLEGDGPLVFSCYEKLNAVPEACQAPNFPNVRAVVAAIVNEDPNQRAAALEQRAKACVQLTIQWFLRKFNVDLYDAVTAFRAAGVMCPMTVGWLRPTRASVEALRIFPFLDNDATIDGLVRELPQYITATQDVAIEGTKVEWWKRGFLIGLLQSRKSYLFNLLLLP